MKRNTNKNKLINPLENIKQGFNNIETQRKGIQKQFNEWHNDNQRLILLNDKLAKANAESANLLAELQEKNHKLNSMNNKLTIANAKSEELMAEVEEKNKILSHTNSSLSQANSHAAELMAVIEIKDEEIIKLNKSLSIVNARSANLVAKRELQFVEIKELNRELQYEIDVRQKTEENLKESNASKDRFFSIIAHDLRTPFISIVDLMTIINEHSEFLSKEEIMELVQELSENAQNTQTLLENLLEWAKTQSGRLVIEPEAYTLKSIVDETIPALENQAISKGISIESNIDKNITIWADKNMISTVIRNLVSNAIKFSNPNNIVSIYTLENEGIIKLNIKDQGLGISLKNQKKLFSIDAKISSIGTANEKGGGLGLILCKEFIEKHGGQISVKSKPGEGSTFSFTVTKA